MGDKYYKAIQWLKKHPDQIRCSWNAANGENYTPGSILFKGLFSTKCNQFELLSFAGCCPTQIKNGGGPAPTPLLKEMILADKNIPYEGSKIRLKHLPAFAKYQRLADKINGKKTKKNSKLSV